jgi:hypothetical protein
VIYVPMNDPIKNHRKYHDLCHIGHWIYDMIVREVLMKYNHHKEHAIKYNTHITPKLHRLVGKKRSL